jgi:chaperonin cofactor prefoldin
LHITNLSDVTALIAILSFIGGIVTFLFKKIVIEPLKQSIDSLKNTIEGFQKTSEKRMDLTDKRVDLLEKQVTRFDEKFITVFTILKELKGDDRHVNNQ